jgi:hypothetical protein
LAAIDWWSGRDVPASASPKPLARRVGYLIVG